MNLKQEHKIFGLVAIAGLIVLYVLYRQSQAQNAASENPDGISGAGVVPEIPSTQQYPQAPAPVQLGDVILNAPPEQTANMSLNGEQIPRLQVGPTNTGECGCDDDDCEGAGVPVTVITVPEPVFKAGVENLQSFQAKPGMAA